MIYIHLSISILNKFNIMSIIKLISISICLLLFYTQQVYADTYLPEKGEAFVFYPASDVIKRTVPGFDCFYDASLVIKNGDKNNIKTKPKYRFKADKNGVTPYSEIEGHYFVLRDYWKTSYKTVDKQIFYMTLVRDDGEYLLLRIPFIGKDTDNELTKSMSLKSKSPKYPYNFNYYISVPACNKEDYDYIKEEFNGRDFMPTYTYYTKNSNEEKLYNAAKVFTSYLNPIVSFDIYKYNKDLVHCDSISFMNIKSYAFKQPVITGSCNGVSILIPACEFRGNGDLYNGYIYSISQLLTLKDAIIKKDLDQIGIGDVVGKPMVYEACSQDKRYDARKGRDVSTRFEALQYGTNIKYNLVNEEIYDCIGTDIVFEDYTHNVHLIFKDKDGQKFSISARSIHYGNRSEYLHDHFVSPNQHEINLQVKRDRIKDAEEREKAKEQEKKDKIAALSKKYGKNNAKIIADGHVRIGFTKEMCREAMGNPWEINYLENAWGDYEQWYYQGGTYLYFTNGKVSTIQQM